MKIDLDCLIADAKKIQLGKKKPKYSLEFKRRAVDASQQMSIKDLSKVLGISYSALSRWRGVSSIKSSTTESPCKDQSIEFAPVVPDASLVSPETPSQQHFELDLSDDDGRHVKLKLPWSGDLSGPLMQLISQALLPGGHRCFK